MSSLLWCGRVQLGARLAADHEIKIQDQDTYDISFGCTGVDNQQARHTTLIRVASFLVLPSLPER